LDAGKSGAFGGDVERVPVGVLAGGVVRQCQRAVCLQGSLGGQGPVTVGQAVDGRTKGLVLVYQGTHGDPGSFSKAVDFR